MPSLGHMKPIIRKSDLLVIKKNLDLQPVAQADDVDTSQPIVNAVTPSPEEQPDLAPQTSATESYLRHTPAPDYPLTGSVGNSGWQVSDIWRDLRIDTFCD